MKKFIIITAIFCLAGIFLSCEALPVNYSKSQSWSISQKTPQKKMVTLALLGVHVDKTGGWASIEKETSALAPLYFWNRGYKVVDTGERPVYAAEIHLREREFNFGWNSRRSLAVEVHIWAYEDAPAADAQAHEQKLPVAVGRIVAIGDKTFSSSEITDRLLSKAIGKAAKQLAANEKQKNRERQKKNA